jgi:hypothetical protein
VSLLGPYSRRLNERRLAGPCVQVGAASNRSSDVYGHAVMKLGVGSTHGRNCDDVQATRLATKMTLPGGPRPDASFGLLRRCG